MLTSLLSVRAQNDLVKDLDKLELFLKSVDGRYVDSVATSNLVERGMRSMLEELDPHSVYMNARQYKAATEPLAGKYEGIGIRYQVVEDTMTVLDVIPGSPADKYRLKTGDRIIAIGDDTLAGKGISSSKMARTLKEEDNTELPLALLRGNERALVEQVLPRAKVQVSSVPTHFVMDNKTGYIRLTRFSSTSLSDFRSALDALNAQRVDNLVLDLRGNSGGYLNVAIKIVDEFLDDRKLIVYTEGLHQTRKETMATSGGRFVDGNVVVLIDEHSASASEIVAGAIQDWDRGLIVGRRSYGKGLVQRTVEFDDGSAMRLTISRYYTPTGRSIQKPYDDGVDAYRSDLRSRARHGELYSADSIYYNDSLIYYTPGKRKVYGGGGIIPDVFVPADSNTRTDFCSKALRAGLFYGFTIQYTEDHGKAIRSDFKDVNAFADRFKVDQALLDAFRNYAARREIETDDAEFVQSQEELEERIKINIARFVYGYESYYYVSALYDEGIAKALEEIANGSFKELGLN